MTAYQPPPGYGTPQARTRPSALLVALAAVVVAVVAVAAFLAGRSAAADGGSGTGGGGGVTVPSPYGPASFTDGIAHGYTHDEGGAAAAALNFLAAQGLCLMGQIDCGKAAATLASTAADPVIRSLLRTENASDSGYISPYLARPLAVLSVDRAGDTATVRIWDSYVDGPSIGKAADPSVTLKATYITIALEMVWEGGDWKASAVKSTTPGPQPASTPATDAFGWIGSQWVLYTGAR